MQICRVRSGGHPDRGERTRTSRGTPWLGCLLLLLSVACGTPEPFVWVQSLPPAALTHPSTYVIDSGDLLDVRVFNGDGYSGRVRVRNDGKITLPMLGDIDARGKTPTQLAAELGLNLKRYITNPVVTIGIDEAHPISVTVLGEVGRAGVYQLPQHASVIEALANAGGFTENADKDSIFVVRTLPPLRVRFTYQLLTSASSRAAAAFPLQGGDVVTVE